MLSEVEVVDEAFLRTLEVPGTIGAVARGGREGVSATHGREPYWHLRTWGGTELRSSVRALLFRELAASLPDNAVVLGWFGPSDDDKAMLRAFVERGGGQAASSSAVVMVIGFASVLRQ